MTSYQASDRINAQALLFALAGAVHGAAVAILASFPTLLAILAGIVKVLVPLVIGAGLVAVLAMIPLTFWAGLAITGALAYAGYPRTRAPRSGWGVRNGQ